MASKRSIVMGDTNYIGASVSDIRAHVRGWLSSTENTITTLLSCQSELLQNRARLHRPDEIDEFIETIVLDLERFGVDFERLSGELEKPVVSGTVELVRSLYQRSRALDHLCRDFKYEYESIGMKDEELRPLIDKIYKDARGQVLDY